MNTENFKPEGIDGDGPKSTYESRVGDLRRWVGGYACRLEWLGEGDEKPRWCVYGNDGYGTRGVIHWIRPVSNDEFVARKIADLISRTGGSARAEMTEWNKGLKGAPVYASEKTPLSPGADSPPEGAA